MPNISSNSSLDLDSEWGRMIARLNSNQSYVIPTTPPRPARTFYRVSFGRDRATVKECISGGYNSKKEAIENAIKSNTIDIKGACERLNNWMANLSKYKQRKDMLDKLAQEDA